MESELNRRLLALTISHRYRPRRERLGMTLALLAGYFGFLYQWLIN